MELAGKCGHNSQTSAVTSHRHSQDALASVSRLGRTARVGLVLASQSFDGNTIDEQVLINVGWRLVGFAPSKMSREALGEHAERYGLDTSKMLVDAVQTGTALLVAPNVDKYAVCRGFYQSTDAVTATVGRLVATRGRATPAPLTVVPDAVVVPAELAVIAGLAREAAAGRPIVATTEILTALDDGLSPRTLSDSLLRWTGHRSDRQNHGGRELRGPRVEHVLAAVARIESGGPVELDDTTGL